jgi:hypothetical protein
MKLRLFYFGLIVLLVRCARPCPADIKLGDLNLSAATRAFVPAGQRVDQLVFTNAAGQKLTFTNNSGSAQAKRFQLNVETLCQRGDFLDKTAQTAYFNAESYHLYYQSGSPNYTLSVGAQPENAGTYGSRSDTVFYEVFSASGQRLDAPTQVGSLRLLPSERGNGAKIPEQTRVNNTEFRFVADTSILGKNIKNTWVTADNGKHSFFIFYTKELGIEAFTTKNGEQWVRQ